MNLYVFYSANTKDDAWRLLIECKLDDYERLLLFKELDEVKVNCNDEIEILRTPLVQVGLYNTKLNMYQR